MLKTAFPAIADADSKLLLLGTMPGEQSLKHRQYYAHKGNQFWKIMFSIFNQPLVDNYELRKQLLLNNKVALWDVLQYCQRDGSADRNIKNPAANDFASFYTKYPSVKNVFFTSGKAQEYYDTYVGRNGSVNYHNLPSPSRANTWKTFDEKVDLWKVILKYLQMQAKI